MKRAYNPRDVISKKFKLAEFEGKWLEAIGKPELTGSWIIWGNSGQGKTRFSLQLAKYLSQFTRVIYDSLEEGISESLKRAIESIGLYDAKVLFIDKERLNDLKIRLKKHKSPKIIFIDSFQYTGMSYKDYQQLKEEFPSKLFVFISHADGKDPKGSPARQVMYDANVKIRVEGFKAEIISRYSEKQKSEYVIWKEGAERYWVE